MVTGLTRDGVWLVENGKIVHPVNNFRFNESPVNLLKNLEATSVATPAGSEFFALTVPAVCRARLSFHVEERRGLRLWTNAAAGSAIAQVTQEAPKWGKRFAFL